LERESLVRNVGLSIPRDDHIVNGKNGIVKRIFWRLPTQIFDEVGKFYLGGTGKV